MHDQDFDDRFAAFRAGGPLVVPAGPGAVRAVHRHRRRMHAVTGGALVALLVAGTPVAVTAIDQRPDRPNVTTTGHPTPSTEDSPTPTPEPTRSVPEPTDSTTPATEVPKEPTSVPAAAMLQESDVPGFERYNPEHEGDGTFAATTVFCPDGVPDLSVQATADRRVFFTDGSTSADEIVERYRSAAEAGRVFDWLRAVVAHCDAGDGIEQAIAAEGFAGDESMLIVTDIGGRLSTHAYVRQGPLVAQISPADEAGRAEVRRLAGRAAERLCAGTNSC